MISLAALRLLLRKVPGIVWAGIIVTLLVAGAFWFTYRAGAVHEQRTAHRAALADSTQKEDSVHATTITRTDSARNVTDNKRALARFMTRAADSSRAVREKLRAEVEPMLKDAPLPLVQLVHMDDQQIRRDDAASETYLAVDTALVNERLASLAERHSAGKLDTLHQHQITVGIDPPKTHHGRTFVVGAAIGVASMLLLHAVR